MPAPLIGLTTRNTSHPKQDWPMLSTPKSYTQALIRAGAVPVLVPVNTPSSLLPDLLARLDGIIFTGGGDIETSRFNGQPHAKVYGVDLERDEIELEMVEQMIAAQMPFLGICRGFQVINVALGGSLYTHILDQLEGALDHSYNPAYPTDHPAHTVRLKPGSQLAEIFGVEQINVNSLHHQGAELLASQLEATGWAPDGLTESFTLPDHPFGLGVQWHPEWMPDDEIQPRLFAAFRQAAADYAAQKEGK
jgi:putative glutamine amidotransferase